MTDEELAQEIREIAYSFLYNEGFIQEEDKVSNEEALKLLHELIE